MVAAREGLSAPSANGATEFDENSGEECIAGLPFKVSYELSLALVPDAFELLDEIYLPRLHLW